MKKILVKKSQKMLHNLNFQNIKKILCTSVDNFVLQILLKFQVDRIKIVRVLLLSSRVEKSSFDKNTFGRLKVAYLLYLLYLSFKAFNPIGCTPKIKYFEVPDPLHYFWIPKEHFAKKNFFFAKFTSSTCSTCPLRRSIR